MGASRWFFSISGVILIVGGPAWRPSSSTSASTSSREPGSRSALEAKTDEEGVRDALAKAGIKGEEIQAVSDKNSARTSSRSSARTRAERSTRGRGGDRLGIRDRRRRLRQHQRRSDLRPIGRHSALKALIFSLLVICGYVALRFDPKFAVPVLIAIFHDILITAGVYSLTGKEVSSGRSPPS